jgi:uncharacterized protein YbaP (TraB family)
MISEFDPAFMNHDRLPAVLRDRGFGIARMVLLVAATALSLPAWSADCRPVAEERSAARPGDFRRGILWKIESTGHAPSHLFGTYHSNDPRITRLPCPVQSVFQASTSYTMELIFNGAAFSSMGEAMFFAPSDKRTLKDVLGEPLYQDTLRALKDCRCALTESIPRMKPWAVFMRLGSPRPSGRGLPLDLALQWDATLAGKPTYGLETMKEQVAVFDGMTIEDQVVLLRETLNSLKLAPQAMDALTRAYLARDLAGLAALNNELRPADARVHDRLMQRLLTERNHHMAERMRERLAEGNAFIAVGALHLPGDDGLLQLLSKAGYRVSRVY